LAKATRASTQYIALALLFTFAATYQARFLIDLWRDFTFQYSAPPFWLGSPWPTVIDVFDRAREAGLRSGDKILSVDGRSLDGSSDLNRPIRLKRPGDTIDVVAERHGVERRHVVPLTSVRSRRIDVLVYVHAALMLVLMPAFCLLLGFGVAAIRPRDPMAWLLLVMLVSLSQNFLSNVSVLGWPPWLRIPSHVYRALGTLGPACMLLFGIYFTSRWRVDARYPWIKWLVIVPVVVQTLFTMGMQVGISETYRTVEPLVDLFSRRQPAGSAAALLGIVLFFVTIGSKSRDPRLDKDARRRLRLLLWGSAVSLIPLCCLIIFVLIYGFQDNLWSAIPIMLTLLFPVTMAHVIVVHRAMDVRVAIRQGVQYAFVRNGVRALQVIVSAAVVILVTILTERREMPLAARMAIVSVAVASVFFVRTLARRLADWVDRRFFRESYQADAILSDLSAHVRQMLETRPLLQTVAERLSTTLHVPNVAVLVAQNGGFEPALAVGYDSLPAVQFAERAGTIVQLEQGQRPLRVRLEDETSWAYHDGVSAEERRQLERLRARLLLPLTARDRLLGLISLGEKRSEEPYSPTDLRLLASVATQTGMALDNTQLASAVAHEIAQRELLHREIEIASEVQQRLFPQTCPPVEGLEYSGTCRPARGVGGDYYDFLELADGGFGVAIGDVSGKGIPAALLMASLQASLRGQIIRGGQNLAELIASINRLICDASSPNRYATFFYAQYLPSARLLTYVNAGHNAPILLRHEEAIRLAIGGPVVGLLPAATYEQGSIELQRGDLVVLFTDGISESMNAADEEWGEEEVVATAKGCRHRPAVEIRDVLIASAEAFAGGTPQHDDMTVVVLKVGNPDVEGAPSEPIG
jgi:phosphoserine phosphatase RsbU/P